MARRSRFPALLLTIVAALALAVPAFGADPSPSSGPPGQAKEKPGKGPKGPEIQLTLTGTIEAAVDAIGRPDFSMTVNGTVWDLSVGPTWYWGANNPLSAYVGKSVVVVGVHRQGATELHVQTIDGKALRAAGKPPWAGGPKIVGPSHPGSKGAARGHGHGNGHGRATAPGQLEEKNRAEDESEGEASD